METVWSIEVLVTYFIQGMGMWLLPIMKFFSECATEEFFILVMPILYWCVDTAIGMRVGVVIMLSSSLVDILKMAFRFPRPYWLFSKVHSYTQETSFGLPSGHTQKAVAVWGTMAASFKKTWLWIVSIFMIIMIAVSRLYLGVHFLSDIVSGLLVGILFLVVYMKLETPVVRWAGKQSLWTIAITSLSVSLIPILVVAVIRNANAGWQIPTGWLVSNIDPFNMEGIITLNGTQFGMLFGYAWLHRKSRFEIKGTGLQLFSRYILGIAGIFAIRYGLKFIFPETTDLFGYSLRFIRYGFIGLWVTALAPFLFIKLKLSQKALN
ncbi:MAG: phosphatase PAP2 family protein [Anaerolineaceae bacterium]